VIVYDLDVEGVALAPRETDPPLVVDANAILASPITCELFKSTPWGNSKVPNGARGIENREFPVGRSLDLGR
jgi:hypothetical protein